MSIVENDHAGMRRSAAALGVHDYRLFAMAITQRYVPTEKVIRCITA
jgi:hypothetical protein